MLVVLGVLLAMFSQFGTAFAVRESTTSWLERLQPTPSPPVVTPTPVDPTPVPTLPGTTPTATARPLPEQSVGPVEVTDALKRGVVLITGRTPAEGQPWPGLDHPARCALLMATVAELRRCPAYPHPELTPAAEALLAACVKANGRLW